MPGDLYERDVLIWSEQQADLLRRLSLGERVNEQVDWPHVIEELRDVGLSELHAVRSLLRQALRHLLMLHGWPDGPVSHWRAEVAVFLVDAHGRFVPSMRQRIDVQQLYKDALKSAHLMEINGHPPRSFPATCPITLDELLTVDFDPGALVAALDPPTT